MNDAVADYRDVEKWEEALASEDAGKAQMKALFDRWPSVESLLGDQESYRKTADDEEENR